MLNRDMTSFIYHSRSGKPVSISMEKQIKYFFRYHINGDDEWSMPYDTFNKAYEALLEDLGEEEDSFP